MVIGSRWMEGARRFGGTAIFMFDLYIKKTERIPMDFWQAVFLIYSASFLRGILENIKNIKDIGGDGRYRVITLLIVIGEKKAKTLIGALVFLIAVLVSFVFSLNALTLATALTFGTVFFLVIMCRPFEERYFFYYVFHFLYGVCAGSTLSFVAYA